MSDVVPFTLPFDPYDTYVLRTLLVVYWPAFLAEIFLVLLLARQCIGQDRPQPGPKIRRSTSGALFTTIPFFLWGFRASRELYWTFNTAHTQEAVLWFSVYSSGLSLVTIVAVQGLASACLSPRAPSLGLAGNCRTAAAASVLAVLLDSFTCIYFVRVFAP